jgi:hypothetical protein
MQLVGQGCTHHATTPSEHMAAQAKDRTYIGGWDSLPLCVHRQTHNH